MDVPPSGYIACGHEHYAIMVVLQVETIFYRFCRCIYPHTCVLVVTCTQTHKTHTHQKYKIQTQNIYLNSSITRLWFWDGKLFKLSSRYFYMHKQTKWGSYGINLPCNGKNPRPEGALSLDMAMSLDMTHSATLTGNRPFGMVYLMNWR